MALKTKEIAEKKSSGNLAKVIFPGQHKVKLNNLELKRFNFMESEGGYYLIMNIETEPIEGFEGFFIDPNDESKGRYEGQVGQVKTNKYFYKDNTLPSGVQISRDEEIIKQIKNICVETDCLDWLVKADGKFDTIEDLVEGFNKAKPFADKYMNMTIGGKEYLNKQNHYNYDLFLPKYKKGFTLYESATKEKSNLLPFNEEDHVQRAEKSDVGGFSGNGNTLSDLPTSAEMPFDTDDTMPDFEL
jgi:hypothetical protein